MALRLETDRLVLREIEEGDFEEAQRILGDPEVMYAWEHGFSEGETRGWIAENIARYRRDGVSFLAANEKRSGRLIGFIGPLIETVEERRCVGVAYILEKESWGKGLASEGVRAALGYIFGVLGSQEAVAVIRPENSASRRLASGLGMSEKGRFIKFYRGREMPHIVYALSADEWKAGEKQHSTP